MTTRGVINSNFYQIVFVDGDGNPTQIDPAYIQGGNSNNANYANFAGTAFSVDVANVVGIGNIATVNLSGNGQQVLLGNGTWGLNGGAISNYANYAGNVTNSAQPNITSVGTLTSLSVTNTITAGNVSTPTVYNNGMQMQGYDYVQMQYSNVVTLPVSPYDIGVGSWFYLDAGGATWQSNTTGTFKEVILGNDGSVNASGNVTAPYFIGNGSSLTSLTGANVTGSVAQSNYANIANSVAGANVSGSVAQSNYANIANSVAGANVTGQVGNALVAGTVYSSSQPNITSVGTLTGLTSSANITAPYFIGNVVGNISGNIVVPGLQWDVLYNNTGNAGASENFKFDASANVLTVTGNIIANNINGGNLVTSNYFSGNGVSITGLTLTNSLSDVLITTPGTGQYLGYNGVNWVNSTISGTVSAGQGVGFWFTGPTITTTSANNVIEIDTLSSSPNTAAQFYATATINATTQPIIATLSTSLGRTVIDAGNWDFSVWANSNTTGGTVNIQPAVYTVNAGAGTITITGTGTTRTATASTDAPFLNSVGSANVQLCSWLETPKGLYQISAKSSSTVVTITTPSAYVNDTAAAYSVYDNFFTLTAATVTSTTLSEYVFNTTQTSKAISTTTQLGVLVLGTTSNSKLLRVSVNGTTQSSHVATPLVTLHDSLAGLQGGQSNEYYHLTQAEYTGTGTDIFVRQNSPQLVTPNIDSATGTSLNLSGNVTTGNASLGNLTTSNYFSGNGSLLSSITGANVTGQVGNALVAGTVYTAAQPNITSVGTLTSLGVTGNIVAGNISGANLISANFFSGNGYLLTGITSTTGNANYANFAGTVVNASQSNITSLGTLTGLNVNSSINANSFTSNVATGTAPFTVTSTTQVANLTVAFANVANTANSVAGGNVSGQVGNALIAGTVYTNAQPNITSVGTLTSLAITGNVSANIFTSNVATGNAPFIVTSTTQVANLTVAFANVANTANAVAGANVSGQVGNALVAGTVYTNAQPNITSVGSLTGLTVSNATGVVNFTTTANVTLGAVGN